MKKGLYVLMLMAICSCHSQEKKQPSASISSIDSVYQESMKRQEEKEISRKIANSKKHDNLTNEDLYKCVSVKFINNDFVIDSLENVARKYFKLELISKEEFNNERKNAVNYLISDSSKFPKKNGITTLPYSNGDVQYVDVYPDEASMREYFYCGHYDDPDLYLMYVQYYEAGCSYWLIDKRDSSLKTEFPYPPYFTPDKKNIIAVAFEPYGDYNSTLKLCTMKRNSIICIFQASFINWAPSSEEQGYMSTDGCFRVPIISSDFIWTQEGKFNENYQYLKITVL